MTDTRQGLVGTIALLAATVALLFAGALQTDEDEAAPTVSGEEAPDEPAASLDPEALLDLGVERTPLVSRRVAKLREIAFEKVPEPQISDTSELRALAQNELDKPKVGREIAAGDAELKLLGLLEPDASLGDVATDVTASAAAYYDPEKGELFLVGDSVPAGPQLAEFVLAHELTHALEDQVFGLPKSAAVSDDRALAESALVEGTATALMTDYAATYLDAGELISESAALDESTSELPRFAEQEVTFTYLQGQRFVDELRRTGDGWQLVDFAYRARLPETTEQILHPEKYLSDEGALPVPTPPSPGAGWTEDDKGTLGEFATREILREDAEEVGADSAAAGWGGDAYRLFSMVDAGACVESCRSSHALAITWRGDDDQEAEELAAALEDYAERALGGSPASAGAYELEGGWASVDRRGDLVGLGLAPTENLAARLSGAIE